MEGEVIGIESEIQETFESNSGCEFGPVLVLIHDWLKRRTGRKCICCDASQPWSSQFGGLSSSDSRPSITVLCDGPQFGDVNFLLCVTLRILLPVGGANENRLPLLCLLDFHSTSDQFIQALIGDMSCETSHKSNPVEFAPQIPLSINGRRTTSSRTGMPNCRILNSYFSFPTMERTFFLLYTKSSLSATPGQRTNPLWFHSTSATSGYAGRFIG
jgi:hypothetical protein